MIVADTSALLAVVFGEDDHAVFAEALDRDHVAVSAVSLTEALIVTEARLGVERRADLDLLVQHVVDEVVPVDEAAARAAFAGWRRFGKGRHPAGLNLGDCFSYATARSRDAALLFKGNDFAQTDLRSVLG